MRPVPRGVGIHKVDYDGYRVAFERVSLSMGRFSTKGAEFESRIHGIITTPASMVRYGIQCLATPITCQHGYTFFYPQKRNKKQAEIMIDTLVMSRFQTAAGTNPCIFIERLGFGLNTGDEKHVGDTCNDERLYFNIF